MPDTEPGRDLNKEDLLKIKRQQEAFTGSLKEGKGEPST